MTGSYLLHMGSKVEMMMVNSCWVSFIQDTTDYTYTLSTYVLISYVFIINAVKYNS